jgi:hypothetical protein
LAELIAYLSPAQAEVIRLAKLNGASIQEAATIWLSVNRDFRMGCASPPGESLVRTGLRDGEAYGSTAGIAGAVAADHRLESHAACADHDGERSAEIGAQRAPYASPESRS